MQSHGIGDGFKINAPVNELAGYLPGDQAPAELPDDLPGREILGQQRLFSAQASQSILLARYR